MTLEPVPRPSASSGARAVPGQLTDRARRMIDHALDRVFDEPYEIHSEDDVERVMTEHRATMSFASSAALAGFVERALPLAKLTTKAGKKIPVNDLYHGVLSTFEEAGFREVARPQPHLAIVSLELAAPPAEGQAVLVD